MKSSNIFASTGFAETKKSSFSLIETVMKFSSVSPDELNAYLRGDNPRGKKFVAKNETYKDLDGAILAKMAEEKNWDKVEAYISARRGK